MRLPLALPVTARVQNAAGGCWSATFGAAGVRANDALRYDGVAD